MYLDNFNKAFDKVILNIEGGYVNDPDDYGKETFMGISRKYHPEWEGWRIIDEYKQRYEKLSDALLFSNEELIEAAKKFYKKEFWDKIKGDKIPYFDVALEVFEQAVIFGPKTAIKHLQEALNLLNKNGKVFPDLVIDGIIGPKTLEAILLVPSRLLIKVLNFLEFNRMYDMAKKDKSQEKFIYGWLKRV